MFCFFFFNESITAPTKLICYFKKKVFHPLRKWTKEMNSHFANDMDIEQAPEMSYIVSHQRNANYDCKSVMVEADVSYQVEEFPLFGIRII
jgi:hypothetical protein